MALVFAAVAIRFLKPEWQQWYSGLALAGLVCTLLYILSQWREVARSFSGGRRGSARWPSPASSSCSAILVAINYLGVAAQQALGPDGRQAVLAVGPDPQDPGGAAEAGQRSRSSRRPTTSQRFRERLDEYQYASKQVSVEYIDAVKSPSRANQYQVQQLGTVVFEYDGRTERVTSDGEQELTNGLIKVVQGQAAQGLLRPGPRREEHRRLATATATARSPASLGAENYAVDKLVLAQQKDVPADASVLIVAGPKTDFFAAGSRHAEALSREGRQGLLHARSAGQGRRRRAHAASSALLKDWAIEVGNNVVVDVSGMGQLLGTGPEAPVAAKYQPHPITDRFNLLTAYPLARSVAPVDRRHERQVRADARRDQPEQLGRNRHQDAEHVRSGGARSGQGRQGRARSRSRPRCRRRRPTCRRRRRQPAPEAGGHAASRRRASSCSATPTSPPTAGSASRATATCS